MFDFFRRGSGPSPRQIERAVKKLTEPAGEQGPRYEAAERLAEWGTPESLLGLLRRFTISSRVITQDIEEKRMVVDLLVSLGDQAVDPILKFMRSQHQVDWPVQALARLVPEDQLVGHLMDVIRTVAESEFAAPAHRVSLIRAVQPHMTPEMAPVIEGFLGDDDDDVRIAAIEALTGAGGAETVREKLLDAFLASSDRPRIQRRILELFADAEWDVKGFRPRVEEALLDGFALSAKGVVRRRD